MFYRVLRKLSDGTAPQVATSSSEIGALSYAQKLSKNDCCETIVTRDSDELCVRFKNGKRIRREQAPFDLDEAQ